MKRDEENLARLLRASSPSAERTELARVRILHRIRSAAASGELPNDNVIDSRSGNLWRRRALPVMVASLALLAVSAALWRSRVSDKSLGAMEGSLSSIIAGQVVRSSAGAILHLKDGSVIEMRPNSELALEPATDGLSIRLNIGSVLITAAKQHSGHLYVRTRDMTVSVVGTVFLVNAEQAGSRVAVIQGEVRVQQGESAKKLQPGEQIMSNPLMQPHPMFEEVAWSRTAKTQLALLQQAATSASLPKTAEAAQPQFAAASIRPVQGERPTRIRCRGIDGELDVASAGFTGTGVPQGRCVGGSVPLLFLVATAYDIPRERVSGPTGSEGQGA
jgi:ferric-dicitrate binding protein FerR (iron transport regulator)